MEENIYDANKNEAELLNSVEYDSDKDSVLKFGRETPLQIDTNASCLPKRLTAVSESTIGWTDLPHKDQLIVIVLARLSEPLVQTSLQAYMFYQLKWFDPTLSDSVISSQAGFLNASFTLAQLFTAMPWGYAADSKWAGRKTVIMIGLLGTLISCVGFGFSTTYSQALFFRFLAGATSGNIGVLRTMISETVREKKYQKRAFVILPMTYNIGVVIGPILGGILSDPAGSYPSLFGQVEFFRKYPWALANLVSAFYLVISSILCWLMLEETLDTIRDKRDLGLVIGRKIWGSIWRRKPGIAYKPLHSQLSSVNTFETEMEESPVSSRTTSSESSRPIPKAHKGPRYTAKLPFRRIFTPNVLYTFLVYFFLAFHVGTFNSLWFVFLSTPVYDHTLNSNTSNFTPHLPIRFTGGLGLPAHSVGVAMALLGGFGVLMQIFLFPRISERLGTVRSWRWSMALFPVSYTLMPYLSVVPSTTAPPSQKTGPVIWIAIAAVLLIQVTGRTFALPTQTILVNNCSPHPSVLGTVHALGQSVNSFARTAGPVIGGWLYGLGLSHGLVGGVFWGMAGMAIFGLVVSLWVREGNGHEIWLEGDAEEEEW
ncbi:major facilitator superfamily transporter [Camillea tinctor]|nr:major facilitator superfamily transporter [Camillea tinctor]